MTSTSTTAGGSAQELANLAVESLSRKRINPQTAIKYNEQKDFFPTNEFAYYLHNCIPA